MPACGFFKRGEQLIVAMPSQKGLKFFFQSFFGLPFSFSKRGEQFPVLSIFSIFFEKPLPVLSFEVLFLLSFFLPIRNNNNQTIVFLLLHFLQSSFLC
jgi:hypothetical protein